MSACFSLCLFFPPAFLFFYKLFLSCSYYLLHFFFFTPPAFFLLNLPLPPRASPVYRLCRRAPRASPVSRLSRRVERRVARPSPPSLPPRASLVSQLRRGALEPVRCTGCAAGWSLAPPPPSGLPVSRLCCGL